MVPAKTYTTVEAMSCYGDGCHFLYCLRMYSMTGTGDDGIESAVSVIVVFNFAYGAIWFHEGVWTFHYVTVTFFLLFLDVASVRVFDAIVEVILGIRLEIYVKYFIYYEFCLRVTAYVCILNDIMMQRASYFLYIFYNTLRSSYALCSYRLYCFSDFISHAST